MALLVLSVLAMMAGQLAGQPVLLSFVETGSMAPTMQPGDGFIAIPAVLAGPPERGDVITFEAKNLDGGGLTTHRVVGETESGYITQGDANAVTDQDGPEPPVTREQIKAEALQIGDTLVVIPKIGLLALGVRGAVSGLQQFLATTFGTRAFLGPQGLAYIFAAFGVLSYAGSYFFGTHSDRSRGRTRNRSTGVVNASLIVGGLTVALMVLITLTMVVPGGVHTFEYVAAESDSPGPDVIKTGTTETISYSIPSTGFIPTVVYLEPKSDRLTVTPRELYVGSGQTRTALVEITAQSETGPGAQHMAEHRYIAVLPQSTIRGLYNVHPWAPIIAIDGMFGIGFASFALALLGLGPIRIEPA
jgi:signal peptidase